MTREVWYHGSPLHLETLSLGSAMTRDRRMAEVFSHKPHLVLVDDDGRIRHDGRASGRLYAIDEPVASEDVEPHPRSTMAIGTEWLTRRPLRLVCLGSVAISPEESLSEREIGDLVARISVDRRDGE